MVSGRSATRSYVLIASRLRISLARAVLEALGFFALVEVVGLAALPLAALAFERLPGSGLGFSKPVGLLLVTWAVWMAGSIGVAPYTTATVLAVAALMALAGGLVAGRQSVQTRGGDWRAWRRARPQDPVRRRLWIGSEVVFAAAFAVMVLLVAYSPDVWGTEKPMDMAFVNAANASSSFPPHDPWTAGEDLNYYYLGHLGVAPDHGYNLAFALLAALSATAVFTLAGTLWAAARPRLGAVRGGPVAAGLAAVVVCL